MAVIQYRDSDGNIRTVNAIKGDRGPIGPRGNAGPVGPKGDKGGTIIKGSRPTFNDLLIDQPILNVAIGDGYLIEEDNSLCIWDGENWIKNTNFVPIKLDDLVDVRLSSDVLDNATFLAYDVTSNSWVNKKIDVDAGLLSTSEMILVDMTNGVGGYDENTIIPAGTTFNDFVKRIVHRPTLPTYIQPTLDISCNLQSAELSTYVNPIISISYTPNDAGNFKICRLYRDNSLIDIYTDLINQINVNTYILNKTSRFRIEIEYDKGILKNDSDGKPYPNTQILAGIITKEISIDAINSYWHYSSSDIHIPSTELIESLGQKALGITSGSKISIDTDDYTKSVVFAYPKSLGDCTEIDYVGFDKRNKDVFQRIELTMVTPGGVALIPYYVYYYIAPIEIGPATFILTV